MGCCEERGCWTGPRTHSVRLTCWSYIAAPDWLARERARPTLLIFTHKHIDRDWNVIHGMASGYKYGTGLWHTRLKAKMPKRWNRAPGTNNGTTALQKSIGNTIFLRSPKRRDCEKNIQHFCSWLLKKILWTLTMIFLVVLFAQNL